MTIKALDDQLNKQGLFAVTFSFGVGIFEKKGYKLVSFSGWGE